MRLLMLISYRPFINWATTKKSKTEQRWFAKPSWKKGHLFVALCTNRIARILVLIVDLANTYECAKMLWCKIVDFSSFVCLRLVSVPVSCCAVSLPGALFTFDAIFCCHAITSPTGSSPFLCCGAVGLKIAFGFCSIGACCQALLFTWSPRKASGKFSHSVFFFFYARVIAHKTTWPFLSLLLLVFPAPLISCLSTQMSSLWLFVLKPLSLSFDVSAKKC